MYAHQTVESMQIRMFDDQVPQREDPQCSSCKTSLSVYHVLFLRCCSSRSAQATCFDKMLQLLVCTTLMSKAHSRD